MSVLNIKDSQKLEVVRKYIEGDPVYADVDNRPINDLEQRTKDLDRIFTPARGFRIRQTVPASTSVQIEGGVLIPDGTTIDIRSVGSYLITPATAGKIKITLIWFSFETGATDIVEGTEDDIAVGFAALTKPDLPAGSNGAPLAYLYVDEYPTPFDETIAVNTAGHIQDIRPASSLTPFTKFETAAGSLVADSAGGSVGVSYSYPRADHSHPLNVDATLPTILTATGTGTAGVATKYPRLDHTHGLSLETNHLLLRTDLPAAAGSVGTSSNLPRADHAHPLNVNDAIAPAMVALAAAAGSSDRYSRADHVHPMTAALTQAISLYATGMRTTKLDFSGTTDIDISLASPIAVPANTFTNGIFVVAMSEARVVCAAGNSYAASAEIWLEQGATQVRLAGPPTYVAVGLPTGSGRTILGGTSMSWYVAGVTESYTGGSQLSIGIWCKNLPGFLTGGLNWNPAVLTTVNFGRLYATTTGGGTGSISQRILMVFGF